MVSKKIWFAAAGTALCAAVLGGWIVPAVKDAQTLPQSSMQPASSEEILYQLGIADGYVAVYDGSHRQVLSVLDMPLRTLPQEERIRLAEGIPIYSETELRQLLEDYS